MSSDKRHPLIQFAVNIFITVKYTLTGVGLAVVYILWNGVPK